MEQSSSRLYSGTLSQAAQKILAVLRAQNLHAGRHSQSHTYNRRQMAETYYGSQRELLAQSSWSMSQEESRSSETLRPWFSTLYHESSSWWQSSRTSACYQSSQSSPSSQASSCWDSSLQASQTEAYYQRSHIYSHRKHYEPPAYQPSQALPFSQQEAADEASFYHRDRYTLQPRVQERLFEHQSTPLRYSTEEIRPSFIHAISAEDELPDQGWFPTTKHPNACENDLFLACHPVSSFLEKSEEADSSTSGAEKEKDTITSNELEGNVGSDSLANWNLIVSNPAEEDKSGGEERGKIEKQTETETIKNGVIHLLNHSVTRQETNCDASPKLINLFGEEGVELKVDPESLTEAGTGQMINKDHDMQDVLDGVKWKDRGHRESANEMRGIQLLESNRNTSLERNLNIIPTPIMDKMLYCNTEGENFVVKEEKDLVNRDNTPEIEEAGPPPGSENVELSMGSHISSPIQTSLSLQIENQKENHSKAEGTQDMKRDAENSLMQPQTKSVLAVNTADDLELTRKQRTVALEVRLDTTVRSTTAGTDSSTEDGMDTEPHLCSNIPLTEKQYETDIKKVHESLVGDNELKQSGRDRDDSLIPPVDRNECTSTDDLCGESGNTPMLSHKCKTKRSAFRAPCLHQRHDNGQTSNGNIRGSSLSMILASTSSLAAGQISSSVQHLASIKAGERMKSIILPASQTHSERPPLIPSFPLKRKLEIPDYQKAPPPPKIYLSRLPPKWEPPHCIDKMAGQGEVIKQKRNTEIPAVPTTPQTRVGPSIKTGIDLEEHKDHNNSKQNQQIQQRHVEEKQSISSLTCQPLKRKRNKCGPYQGISGPKRSHGGEPYCQSKANYLTTTLTSDPRVKDCGKLNSDEKMEILESSRRAKALVLTLVYQDGTTQLDPEQKVTPPACGLLMLMKNNVDSSVIEDSLWPNDSLVYLKLDHTPVWALQHAHQSPELFTRDVLLQLLSRSQLIVCYKAKDLLRTALQFYRQELSWKQVAGCRIQDPQVSAWLLDPANPSSCYQDLLNKYSKNPCATSALGVKKESQVISGLCSLYWLNMELGSKLQSQGLWDLYSDMELNMIPVLAVMESHCIHVDKEALKRTSDLLGTKMKQLEQEAHRAAGQIFLVTSNAQLRTVLFEKLCLHEHCDNKKLPKTLNKQQQSTSEAALLQLQDLHPLPKIILEYRQLHKIKSTFVDGILSCMMNKKYISSKWHQTSVVTGRISAKHPNFQAVPRQPLQITKKQYIQGKEEEVVSIHPRAMFIPQEGWTFLAADFCQVELRLLAHLSSDPELLRVFNHPQADVFTMLASQWKGVSETEVTSEEREHTKRIVYSIVYGAGRERLSGILGVSAEQARQFQDSFLQTYKEVQAFIQRTIQQCHQHGYVLSIMGRRRTLPNINSPDWSIRMQAERQAVNFVVQGSAADLCKMAMIRIFNLVSSSLLSARLIAQLHDEILYEVEDSQVEQFAALLRSTMESLQHIQPPGIHLKVPLKVAVSSGKSWGSMSELPPTFPSPL